MADYHSPTVVRPSIPASAITPLERTLLTEMFEHEPDGDAIYFYSSDGPGDTIRLDMTELKTMLPEDITSSDPVVDMIRKALAEADPDEGELELDLSDLGEAAIFQNIVRRCAALDHVAIVSAWTCTKMRPDGFGGGVTVVTSDHIPSSSTNDMERNLLDRAEYGDLGCAPGHGIHRILALEEAEVRSMVADIQKAYQDTDASRAEVADSHIRQGCIEAAGKLDLDEDLRCIEFRAAAAAIRIARAASA